METIERPLPTAMEQRPQLKNSYPKVPFSQAVVKGDRIIKGIYMIAKPDIVEIFEKEGMPLKKVGSKIFTNCFKHTDKTPSLMLNLQKKTAHCFSCGFHGDGIDVVMEIRNLSFPEALAYLGYSRKTLLRHQLLEIKTEQAISRKKREHVIAFRKLENSYHTYICAIYRCVDKHLCKVEALCAVRNDNDIAPLSWFYKTRSNLEFILEQLEQGTDKEKYDLLKQVGEEGWESIIQREGKQK